MLRYATVPLARAWNTWSSRPAEMVFLPLGVRVTPLAYADSIRHRDAISARRGRALWPPFPRWQPRRSRPRSCRHRARMALHQDRAPSLLQVPGGPRSSASGDCVSGINLCLSADEGQIVRYAAVEKAAIVKVGHRFVALASAAEPVQVTGHESVEAVAQHYEAHGYFQRRGAIASAHGPGIAVQSRNDARQPLRDRGRGSRGHGRRAGPCMREPPQKRAPPMPDANWPPRRCTRRYSRCNGLEYGLGRDQPAPLHLDQPQLESVEVRRLWRLAQRSAICGIDDRHARP